MSPRTTTIIGGIGRTLITLGCLTLGFAGFQLWGTGLAEDRAQSSLATDFTARQQAYANFAEANGVDIETLGGTAPTTAVPDADSSTIPEDDNPVIDPNADPDAPATTTTAPAPLDPVQPVSNVPKELLPKAGEALGVIRIPKIGVDKVIIAGTRRDDLRKGPGHYGSTPLPGQAGNAAIAGHRTTYGAPFGDIDLLVPGDIIEVETFQGTFNYEVLPVETTAGISGHSIVTPFDVQVLDDYGDNRLTLTACHPKYSARQRIVVQAKLVNPPAATIALPSTVDLAAEDLSNPELAFEATGVDPATGEIVEGSDALDPTINQDAASADEGNTVGTTPEALDESLGWHMEELQPFIMWSIFTALAAALAMLVARKWRRWPSYAMASPAILALLFFSFTHLDRMLPAF